MKIGIDMMGGDYAPKEVVKGIQLCKESFDSSVELVLIGKEEIIRDELKNAGENPESYTIVNATEVIDMGEHPTKAFAQKKDSSVAVGFGLLAQQKIDGFASAGNTGAMLVAAMYSVKTIPGVIRPTISSVLPKVSGGYGIILDVGANSDCKPDILFQFGILGSLYTKHVLKIENPKVGLLNIGEEETKGNLLTQATYPLLEESGKVNFIGNVEGRDLFNDKADVIVCDGFTGNIVLKCAESLYELIYKRGLNDEYFDRFNYEDYGGTPILGVNAPVVIGHGISNGKAFYNMIKLTRDLIDSKLVDIFKNVFN